jgi:MoaA/NifB/PqqE/SkfB family radical SAM enzyme
MHQIDLSKVTIETTSVCNIRCVMCPQAIGIVHRAKHLPEKVIDGMRPALATARYFELHGIGEPLLSPAFWRALALIRELNPTAMAVVNSNLVVLNDKMLADLAASTLEVLNVSLDASNAETYRKIRGADFEAVLKNIGRVLEARGPRLKLKVNMTVMKENLAEVPDFVRLAHRLRVDEAIIWPINDYGPEDALMATWETNLRGWHFVYREQLLTDISERVRATLSEAKAVASDLGMSFNTGNFPESSIAA